MAFFSGVLSYSIFGTKSHTVALRGSHGVSVFLMVALVGIFMFRTKLGNR